MVRAVESINLSDFFLYKVTLGLLIIVSGLNFLFLNKSDESSLLNDL